jgi:general stress protein YciG
MDEKEAAKKLGRKGGKRTVDLYGPDHMAKIGKMGGRPRKKEMVKCPTCRGARGGYDTESQDWMNCPACGGTGKVER